jgi:sensor histidine kinase YesM
MNFINNAAHRLIFSNLRRYRVIRHLMFGLLFSISYPLLSINVYSSYVLNIRMMLVWTPLNIINIGVTLYWLVPKYLIHSIWRSFLLLYGCWLVVEVALSYLTNYYLAYPFVWGVSNRPGFWKGLSEILDFYPLVIVNGVALFAIFIRMFKLWRVEQLQRLKMKQEKTDAELQVLRAQLHPHFLFNTLNNLYALILEKSIRAPEMLSRISAILSYVLNDCQAAEVGLQKEIIFCRDYIKLESERYGDRLDLSLDFPNDVGDKMIAPMLFQPFIENAFKHGAAEQVGKVWMSIGLSIRGEEVSFRVINSANPAVSQRSKGGIGITNIERRLELLYPDRYQLLREQDDEKYLICLTINLPPGKPESPHLVIGRSKARQNSHGIYLQYIS